MLRVEFAQALTVIKIAGFSRPTNNRWNQVKGQLFIRLDLLS